MTRLSCVEFQDDRQVSASRPGAGFDADPSVDPGPIHTFLAEKLREPVTRHGKVIRVHRSPESVRAMLATGSALASFAVDEGILTANPFQRLGKVLQLTATKKARQNRLQKKAMTREQMRRFLAKAEEHGPQMWTLFLLLARTGLRINEALALRMTDLDLEVRVLRVERERVKDHARRWGLGPPKSEHGVRTVALSAQLAAALRRWVEIERAKDKLRHGWVISPPWLFYADRDPGTYDASDQVDGALDDSNVRRVMRAVLQDLHDADRSTGLPVEACFPLHFTPHSGRHTFASQLLSEGRDLQYVRQQLGHESIKLTADTYGAWLPSIAAGANDCLDDVESQTVSHHAG